MRYEIMFIVRPNIEEEALKNLANAYEKVFIDNGAKIESSKDTGQKELAYEIKGHRSGYYFLYVINSKDDKAQKEFDRLASLSEDVIRHMIIKIEN